MKKCSISQEGRNRSILKRGDNNPVSEERGVIKSVYSSWLVVPDAFDMVDEALVCQRSLASIMHCDVLLQSR